MVGADAGRPACERAAADPVTAPGAGGFDPGGRRVRLDAATTGWRPRRGLHERRGDEVRKALVARGCAWQESNLLPLAPQASASRASAVLYSTPALAFRITQRLGALPERPNLPRNCCKV